MQEIGLFCKQRIVFRCKKTCKAHQMCKRNYDLRINDYYVCLMPTAKIYKYSFCFKFSLKSRIIICTTMNNEHHSMNIIRTVFELREVGNAAIASHPVNVKCTCVLACCPERAQCSHVCFRLSRHDSTSLSLPHTV